MLVWNAVLLYEISLDAAKTTIQINKLIIHEIWIRYEAQKFAFVILLYL